MDKQQNIQQPVAWVWQFEDGEFYETPHHTKEECERDCCGYDGMAVPLYTAPPVPRDVLMAFGEAVCDECARHYLGDEEDSEIDLSAIADRYASRVQPEPVNQQLLVALKRLLHKAYKQNWQDNYPSEVECAESAINAAMQK